MRAVYTICILAYFFNRYLANQRKLKGEKEYLNSRELYAPLKDIDIATLKDSRSGYMFKRGVNLPEKTKFLLARLALQRVVIGPKK